MTASPTPTASPEPSPTGSPTSEPSPGSTLTEPTPTPTTTSCGLTPDAPCYSAPASGALDPLYIVLGFVVLLLAAVLTAQLRRP